MENPLDFLAETPAGQEDHVTPPPGDVPEPGSVPEENGAPAEPPPPDPPAAESGPEGRALRQVPISAMLEEREKRHRAEKDASELRTRWEEAQRALAQPPAPEDRLRAALYDQNLRVSRRFAERQHGAELTATVHDWASARCDADPIFNQQIRSSEDPYEAAMQAYNRERILEVVGLGDLEAFRAWRAATLAQPQARPADPNPPAAPAPAPPRSLATAPGTGSAGKPGVNVGPGAAFDALARGFN